MSTFKMINLQWYLQDDQPPMITFKRLINLERTHWRLIILKVINGGWCSSSRLPSRWSTLKVIIGGWPSRWSTSMNLPMITFKMINLQWVPSRCYSMITFKMINLQWYLQDDQPPRYLQDSTSNDYLQDAQPPMITFKMINLQWLPSRWSTSNDYLQEDQPPRLSILNLQDDQPPMVPSRWSTSKINLQEVDQPPMITFKMINLQRVPSRCQPPM